MVNEDNPQALAVVAWLRRDVERDPPVRTVKRDRAHFLQIAWARPRTHGERRGRVGIVALVAEVKTEFLKGSLCVSYPRNIRERSIDHTCTAIFLGNSTVIKCGCGPSELSPVVSASHARVCSTQLPERVWVFVLQTLGPKAEFEGRDGPLGEMANVGPWQRWWLSAYNKSNQ